MSDQVGAFPRGLACVLLLALLGMALAGCAESPPVATPSVPARTATPSTSSTPMATPGSASPGSPGSAQATTGPWTQWSGPYAARAYGYGFIAPDADGYGPAVPVIAVDDQGRVLAFKAAHRTSQAETRVTMPPNQEAMRPAVEAVLKAGYVYPSAAEFRVTDILSATLAPSDWAAAKAALDDGVATAHEPTPNQGSYVADGGSTFLHAGSDRATLDDNHDEGGGWAKVRDQLTTLEQWIGGD